MGKQRKDPVSRKQCGTVAGHAQHVKREERPCASCTEARRVYQAEYRAKRRGEPGKPTKADRRARDERVGEQVLDSEGAGPDSDGYPKFLRAGGREMWDAVRAEFDLSPSGVSVLLEACRLKDRLDKFTAALSSNSTLWFELKEPEELKDGTQQMQVVVNSMVSEARQSQAALATALGKIGVLQQAEKKSAGSSMADEIARKRQERLAAGKASS